MKLGRAYLAELQAYDIDTMIEIRQDAYERYLSR